MGGGGWFYVPKVWSPSGGWWNSPKNWKGNTAIAGVVIVGISAAVFRLSAQLERRPNKGIKPLPSEMWIKHPPGTT